tara:strand:- start:141 stop:593 length:453 start_codon:yes stop_codon:yes gene_type:complete
MALIKCPECKQQISSEAESCPNCGYSGKKKKGCGCLPIIGGILLGIIVLFIIFSIMTSDDSNGGVITDDRTYSHSWRSPVGDEYVKIGRIIVKNDIKVCGEYYVKEIENGELVIACTGNGQDWDYFVVYTSFDKIYRANEEMESKLNPPR